MRTVSVLLLILAAASSLASAQRCTTDVVVNAFDAKTKAVLYGLTSQDFAATAGKDDLHIVNVKPVFRNRVLILVDRSGMDRESLQAVADLVREAPAGMPVSVGIFAQQAVFSRGFITDPDELSAALDDVVARAATIGVRPHITDALLHALDLFGPHRPGDTLLLVTNGAVHLSKSDIKHLSEQLHRSGTRLQLLMGVLPAPSFRVQNASQLFSGWNIAENFSNDLIHLANSTGGVLMGFMNSEWMNSASGGYMLSIDKPSKHGKIRSWTLRLRDAGNDVPPADIFYPQQLPGCAAPQIASLQEKIKPRP